MKLLDRGAPVLVLSQEKALPDRQTDERWKRDKKKTKDETKIEKEDCDRENKHCVSAKRFKGCKDRLR